MAVIKTCNSLIASTELQSTTTSMVENLCSQSVHLYRLRRALVLTSRESMQYTFSLEHA